MVSTKKVYALKVLNKAEMLKRQTVCVCIHVQRERERERERDRRKRGRERGEEGGRKRVRVILHTGRDTSVPH